MADRQPSPAEWQEDGLSGDWLQGPAFTSAGHRAQPLVTQQYRPFILLGILDAILESSCSVQFHVKAVCQLARYYLRNIGCIRRYLDPETSRLVVHVLVTSRLDNLNSLLHCAPGPHCLSCSTSSEFSGQVGGPELAGMTPVTSVLQSLHWLPIAYGCQFKILMLTFKASAQSGSCLCRGHPDSLQTPTQFEIGGSGAAGCSQDKDKMGWQGIFYCGPHSLELPTIGASPVTLAQVL